MSGLPSNLTLLKLREARKTYTEIAEMYGVSRQAVQQRMAHLRQAVKGAKSPLTALLPWDIVGRDDSRKILQQTAYTGLRAFLKSRLDPDGMSQRGWADCRRFKKRIREGNTVALVENLGVIYVPRTEADGELVARWPKGECPPQDPSTLQLYRLSLTEESPE